MSSSVSDLPNSIDIIVHRPEIEIKLEAEIELLKREVEHLKNEFHMLENKYGYECSLNNELIDLLRENHINFRPALKSARYR